jgi:HK97 family phage major capsid protein
MTPRVATSPARPALQSFRRHRPPPLDNLPTEFGQRIFWQYVTAPPGFADPRETLNDEEYRVLSKAASGGGFLVPTDVENKVVAAARAASAVAQVATDVTTAKGETLGFALASTHGTAAWVAESASYTPSDETITQQNLGAFKGGTKLIVSEELMRDEAVDLDNYLAAELGARIGALQEAAFCTGDGSGKPLGLVHASSPYTVVNAATGSSTLYKIADIVAVYKALPSGYRATASWLINADDFASLAGTTDTAGSLAIQSLSFDPPSLLGRPVLIADLPAPAASAKSLVFGDMKRAYGIRRVNGVTFQRQDEIHSDSGQVGLKAAARCDGRPLLADAARILAHSAT